MKRRVNTAQRKGGVLVEGGDGGGVELWLLVHFKLVSAKLTPVNICIEI